MKVFLDTNVLVSALTTRGLCWELLNVAAVEYNLTLADLVLVELERILTEKFGMPTALAESIELTLRELAEITPQGIDKDVFDRNLKFAVTILTASPFCPAKLEPVCGLVASPYVARCIDECLYHGYISSIAPLPVSRQTMQTSSECMTGEMRNLNPVQN